LGLFALFLVSQTTEINADQTAEVVEEAEPEVLEAT